MDTFLGSSINVIWLDCLLKYPAYPAIMIKDLKSQTLHQLYRLYWVTSPHILSVFIHDHCLWQHNHVGPPFLLSVCVSALENLENGLLLCSKYE